MSYAVRNDGLGWRAVQSELDCTESETWQEDPPPIIQAAAPTPIDPLEKLKSFLAANPDVGALLK